MLLKKSNWICTVVIGSASALVLGSTLPSCSPSCEELANCGPHTPSTAGTSGTSGDGGEAGTPDPGTGGTQSQAGTSGEGGGSAGAPLGGAGSGGMSGGEGGTGTAGEGGTPPVKPCAGGCEAPTPICDESTNTCVECLGPPDCASGTNKACDLTSHTCVACLESPDCTGANKKCEPTTHACVECLASPDCPEPATARCAANTCVKCESNDDCTHIAGKGVCDAKVGECVQCTGKDYAACGMDAGTALVCDTLKRTCTTSKEESAGLCAPCVSDAQCYPGQLCVKQAFGTPSKDVGYFCFWRKGDTANGAPALCSSAPPYVSTLLNQGSMDGTTSDVCGLRSSTCIARNQFSSKDCSTSNAPDDQKCGFAPTKDSKCVEFDTGVYQCTMTCLGSTDCPGAPCDTNVAPAVCDLTP